MIASSISSKSILLGSCLLTASTPEKVDSRFYKRPLPARRDLRKRISYLGHRRGLDCIPLEFRFPALGKETFLNLVATSSSADLELRLEWIDHRRILAWPPLAGHLRRCLAATRFVDRRSDRWSHRIGKPRSTGPPYRPVRRAGRRGSLCRSHRSDKAPRSWRPTGFGECNGHRYGPRCDSSVASPSSTDGSWGRSICQRQWQQTVEAPCCRLNSPGWRCWTACQAPGTTTGLCLPQPTCAPARRSSAGCRRRRG